MIITLKEIQSYDPCYAPKQYGITRIKLVNLLRKENIRADHRIWVACHVLARRDKNKLIDFAKWCAVSAAYAADDAYIAADAAYDAAASAAYDAAFDADIERQKQIDYLVKLVGDK